MTRNETVIRLMEERLKKLPEDVQGRIGDIIQGALLMQAREQPRPSGRHEGGERNAST